jgi:hypothetical protein
MLVDGESSLLLARFSRGPSVWTVQHGFWLFSSQK